MKNKYLHGIIMMMRMQECQNHTIAPCMISIYVHSVSMISLNCVYNTTLVNSQIILSRTASKMHHSQWSQFMLLWGTTHSVRGPNSCYSGVPLAVVPIHAIVGRHSQ